MLLYVLESKGSSPGRTGFFMAVNAMGQMSGSIGGGIMEHKFAEMAKDLLQVEKGESPGLRKQVHDKASAVDQSGMICSGEQSIFLHRLQPADADIIAGILSTLSENSHASLRLTPRGIQIIDGLTKTGSTFTRKEDGDWEYIERLGYRNQLSIIGGGHCALALSKLMQSMDFYIRLYDHRADINSFRDNEWVHERILIEDYDRLSTLLLEGEHHYVVIMTLGYRTDDQVIRAIRGKRFSYIGLLGSAFKTKKMMSDYEAAGLGDDWLRSIYAPAGIAIRSQTPEEIAVSIAAEIIRLKNIGA